MRLMIAAVLLSLGITANGQQCSTTVLDESGVLRGNEAVVEAAAKPLQELGAEVHVRTMPSMQGQPNLDHYVQTLVAQCPSWQNSNGSRKGNLLLFVHTKQERAAGIYSGLEFKQPVDDNYVRIIADHMKPKFRQDDHSGALIAGMSETQRVIYQHLHPGSQISTTFVNVGNIGYAIGTVGAIVIVVWLICTAMKWKRRSSREAGQVESKRQAAMIRKKRASSRLMNGQFTLDDLNLKVQHLLTTGTTDFSEVQTLLTKAGAAYEEAWMTYSQYQPGEIDHQPEDKGLRREQYDEFVTVYDNINTQLDKAEALRHQAEQLIE
jgi:uncharacterized membrane protein YgcG